VLKTLEQSSLAAHDEDHTPCSLWRSTVEQRSTCSLWKGPYAGAGGFLKEAVTPWGAPCWSGLLPGPVDPWREEPKPEQVCWQGL